MSDRPDVEFVLRAWFDDGPATMSDRVVDVVAERIGRQPQRRTRRALRRIPMNAMLKVAAVLATVAVIAVVGWNLLPGRSPGVGGPSASPSPSPSPSPSATAAAASASVPLPSWYPVQTDGSGILPAGSHTTLRFLAGSRLTVPEGWVNDADNAKIYTLFPNTPANEAEYGLSKQTAQNIVLAAAVQNNMFAICDATGLFQGATAAEVIDAVVANEAFSTSEPVDVTIGGLSGPQVDVQLSPDWTGSCPLQENDPPTRDYGDARNRLIMLDAPGRGPIGISIGSMYASEFEAFLADAMPIVESLEFDLAP
jgi:hypothetical protein